MFWHVIPILDRCIFEVFVTLNQGFLQNGAITPKSSINYQGLEFYNYILNDFLLYRTIRCIFVFGIQGIDSK